MMNILITKKKNKQKKSELYMCDDEIEPEHAIEPEPLTIVHHIQCSK